ncbi:MAG TPA: serine hydrolase domain-containing protein [Stellaceae bacterium]|nr:serine hydrolase domain-containing protein [Stellaceae bacterium]
MGHRSTGSRRLVAVATAFWLLCGAGPAVALEDGSALAAQPDIAAGIAALQSTIAASMAEREVPGLAIAVVVDQRLVWTKGFGRADLKTGAPVTPHTGFRIGSLTKLFTATAIVQLRDAGRLRLDDPVSASLPWFHLQAGPDDPPITLRDLLTHTSGLSRESGASSWNDRRFPTEAELDADLVEEPPALPPEMRWKYSNLAFAVAGQAVAAISGESYGHYIGAHILAPLGMTETWPVPAADLPGLATGHEPRYRGHREARGFIDLKALGPSGGTVSTVLDLARFAAEQMRETGPGAILRPSSLREMHRAQWVQPDFSAGQGLGFEVRRAGGQTFYGHGGSAGGYTGRLQIDPALHMAVIVLTNAEDGGPNAVVDSAFRLLGPAIARVTLPPRPVPVPDPAWAKYIGTYASRTGESRIAIVDGELAWLPLDAADPAKAKIVLKPVRPNVFRYDSGSLVGELVTFVLDAQGRVIRLDSVGYSDVRK